MKPDRVPDPGIVDPWARPHLSKNFIKNSFKMPECGSRSASRAQNPDPDQAIIRIVTNLID